LKNPASAGFFYGENYFAIPYPQPFRLIYPAPVSIFKSKAGQARLW
jgi:hypothetical protein